MKERIGERVFWGEVAFRRWDRRMLVIDAVHIRVI